LSRGNNRDEIGKVTFVAALWEFEAIRMHKRSLKHNINRMCVEGNACGCMECRRAMELMSLMDRCDVLIDMHASYTAATRPFLICERNPLPNIGPLLVPTACFGFDDVKAGGTDAYMNAKGKVGICVECGFLTDPASTEIARASLMALLRTMGMIAGDPADVPKELLQAEYQYVSKTNCILEKSFADFDAVTAGERIGTDGGVDIRAPKNGCLLFAADQKEPGKEAFVFLGEAEDQSNSTNNGA